MPTLFLTSEWPEINRDAIIDEDDGVAWLYLRQHEPVEILGTAWLFNRAARSDGRTLQQRLKRGMAPRMPRSVIADKGVRRTVRKSAFDFLWSEDGEAVAVLEHGEPLAYVRAGETAGRNRHVTKAHPYARPFNEFEFAQLFRSPTQRKTR